MSSTAVSKVSADEFKAAMVTGGIDGLVTEYVSAGKGSRLATIDLFLGVAAVPKQKDVKSADIYRFMPAAIKATDDSLTGRGLVEVGRYVEKSFCVQLSYARSLIKACGTVKQARACAVTYGTIKLALDSMSDDKAPATPKTLLEKVTALLTAEGVDATELATVKAFVASL